VLLCSQHENGKDKLSSQEHLNEETLCNRGTSSECSAYIQATRKHALDEGRSSNATKNLSDEQKCATEPRKSSNKAHAKGDSGVEESTADPEKDPGVDSEREAETESNVLQLLRVTASLCYGQAGG